MSSDKSQVVGARLNAIKLAILRRCNSCRSLPDNGILCGECQQELQLVLNASPSKLDELEERYCGTKSCPHCGEECRRDEVHNGLALLCGPWGCPSCRWSEDGRFDLRNTSGQPEGIDQYGGYTPPSHYDIVNQ